VGFFLGGALMLCPVAFFATDFFAAVAMAAPRI